MEYTPEYWQEMVDEIMDEFDFSKVHSCMTALNWYWESCRGTPDIRELKQRVRRICRDIVEKGTRIETGGFIVIIDRKDGVLSVQFVVESWDAYKEIPNDTI